MGLFRKASTETKQLPVGDEGDFLVVRTDISKREFNALAEQMPKQAEEGLSIAEAAGFSSVLFETLVVGWSLDEGAPTADDYLSLSAAGSNAIDAALAEHFASLLPDSAEGK
jgi:hypothetical protein